MSRAEKFANATREEWMTDELLAQIQVVASDGRIACAAAQKFARNHGIPMERMSSLLNYCRLKVQSCQLGCF